MAGLFTMKSMKQNFFDRGKVIRAMDAKTRRVLSKFGAFTQRRAKSSIRKAPLVYRLTGKVVKGRRRKDILARPATSLPGRPPYWHPTYMRKRTSRKTGVVSFRAGSPLKDLLFFAWDPSRKSVVIGPEIFRRRSRNAPGRGMELLEYGGSGVMVLRDGSTKRTRHRARPFMAPAYWEEIKNLPAMWRGPF